MEGRRITAVLSARNATMQWPAKICGTQNSRRILDALQNVSLLTGHEIDQRCGGVTIVLTMCDVPPEDVVLAKPCNSVIYTVYAGYVYELGHEVSVVETYGGRLYADIAFFDELRRLSTA